MPDLGSEAVIADVQKRIDSAICLGAALATHEGPEALDEFVDHTLSWALGVAMRVHGKDRVRGFVAAITEAYADSECDHGRCAL